jgi:predicted transcriptional regulator of viral defense system
MKRISILINKTREEVAKEYLTRIDNTAAMDRVMARFDKVEEKLDRLVERK